MSADQDPIAVLLGDWLDTPDIAETITAIHRVEPAEGTFAPYPESVHPALVTALQARGIDRLYAHQAEAIASALRGEDTVLVTPTASGKSLCFHLPVLTTLLDDPNARALYLFPTKALTQDQYTGLHSLIEGCGADIKTFTFDGDTPADARTAVREMGQIVLTNPDMLHAGILPHHTKWLKLFRNLKYVVIDEMHAYGGVFGSHLGNVLRRLERVCAFHGSRPRFVCASATVGNPREHVERLLERAVTVVDRSGAPRASKHVVLVNPPVVNRQLGIRKSYLHVARRLVSDLVAREVPTITFVLSRLNVELLVKYVREDLVRLRRDPDVVQGYRGGYLPTRRREIESGLRAGRVRCVIATNALELGIDVGELTACVIAGYPGTVASVWQQSGRAGRRQGEALAVLVGRSTALDQYLVSNPEYFFGKSPEEARIDPDNPYIVTDHLKCAAFELPFADSEAFGSLGVADTQSALGHLEGSRVVHKAGGRWHWMDRSYPANHVSLRRVDNENFTVIELDHLGRPGNRLIAEVDWKSAHTTLYEHAIYNLDGEQYQVERLDYDDKKAYVRKVQPDYFTYAHTNQKVQVLLEESAPEAALRHHGEVLVTEKVVGFKKVRFETHENVGYGDVSIPEVEMHTTAAWLTVPEDVIAAFDCGREKVVDALRGLGQALHTVATLRMMCNGGDLGLAVDEPEDSGPRVYLYDNIPGGVGFAPRLFAVMEELIAGARQLVSRCGCQDGCPSCIGPAVTPEPGTKGLPMRLADALLDRDRHGGPTIH